MLDSVAPLVKISSRLSVRIPESCPSLPTRRFAVVPKREFGSQRCRTLRHVPNDDVGTAFRDGRCSRHVQIDRFSAPL